MLLSTSCAWAQWEGCYRLYLKDKEGSGYCSLSERSMQRRERQSIALDETDLDVSADYLSQLRAQGWQIVTRSRWLNTVVVRRPDGTAIENEQFASLPFVSRYCCVSDPVGLGSAMAPAMRNSKATDKWQYENSLASASDEDTPARPLEEVKGVALHEAGYRGQGMLIAVLDGGFSLLPQMPFFASKVIGWYDCYAPDQPTGEALFCSSEHGSEVLSIMAADQRDGVWGTAPESQFYVIRTEYDAFEMPLEEDMWIEGAERADSIGADLINSSLGYNTFDAEYYRLTWDDLCQGTEPISVAASIACQKGILVCNAAGNDRTRPWQRISFPADAKEVFTIGAVDLSQTAAVFTGAGCLTPYVKPDVSCRGVNSWFIRPKTGEPSVGSGTSFASPFMCGMMASLWSAVPDDTPEHLQEVVRESCSLSQTPDSLVGYGVPDFEQVMQQLGITFSALDQCASSSPAASCYNLWGMAVDNRRQNGCFIVQNGKKYLLLPR